MRRQKDQVLGIRPLTLLVKTFQGMHFAVPERVFQLVVRFGENERQVGLPQNRGAKDLVAFGNTLRRQRQDVVFDHVEQSTGQFG